MGPNPTCKEVHRLKSEGLDRDLTLVVRFRVRLHLLVCDATSSCGISDAKLKNEQPRGKPRGILKQRELMVRV
jgi:hypothetical protein